MLFQKRHKSAVRIFWVIASVIIIISMVALFGPISPHTVQQQPAPTHSSGDAEIEVNGSDSVTIPAVE